jgi:flavin-dependent dehydrogenase
VAVRCKTEVCPDSPARSTGGGEGAPPAAARGRYHARVGLDAEVCIVGGGPAGICTALFALAEAPRLRDRIVVLEKERYPREKICAGAIGARADRLLDTIGARVAVPSAEVRGISVCARGGALAERRPGGAPIGRVVRRIEHDQALAELARGRGVRIVEGARVGQVTVGGAAPGASSGAGPVRVEWDGGAVTARALVGADGVGSVVRRAMGLGRGRWMAQVVEIDTEPRDADPARDLLHFDVSDGTLRGYAWDFPTVVGGRELVCRGVYELRAEDSGARNGQGPDVGVRLEARLAAQGARAVGKPKRFAERGLTLSEPTAAPRVLLVGEAAGIDPVLGEGIAQAIQYGAAAGRYLARRLATGDLAFADWRRELSRTRLGIDLLVRSSVPNLFYGPTRPAFERWVTGSTRLASAGMRYFAGDHVPRVEIMGALLDLGGAGLRSLRR